jgi:hypothetical protein
MDWQQQFAAIQAFCGHFDVSLRMRKPGDWYVSSNMGIGGDGMVSGAYGNGATPEEAVQDHWNQYSNLPHNRYATIESGDGQRRGRWNGFMWELVTEEDAKRIVEHSRRSS